MTQASQAPSAELKLLQPPKWTAAFGIQCTALSAGVVLPPLWLLINLGHGLVAFIVMGVIVAWPKYFYLRVTQEGVRLRYYFLKSLVRHERIQGVSLQPDPRKFVLGQRGTVLCLDLRDGSRLLVFAPAEQLEQLRAELERIILR